MSSEPRAKTAADRLAFHSEQAETQCARGVRGRFGTALKFLDA
jgi:hypothetical protein